MRYILGLDFGGTKLAAGLYDRDQNRLLCRRECPTPVAGGMQASYAHMLALANSIATETALACSAVGVSFGGPVTADGRVVRLSMHVPGWEQMPLVERLEHDLAIPARMANDGDAAALAEHRLGAGRGFQTMLYVTASTGIGGGIIVGGLLHRGEHGWAGEFGHMVLDPAGPPCPCGRNGCLEALASGLSIARDAQAALAQSNRPVSLLDHRPAAQLTAAVVATAADHGDALAQQIWARAMGWIGVGVGSAANLLNPGRVVIGGGLTRAGDLFFNPVRAEAARRTMDRLLEIVPAALAADTGILGGVALWLG